MAETISLSASTGRTMQIDIWRADATAMVHVTVGGTMTESVAVPGYYTFARPALSAGRHVVQIKDTAFPNVSPVLLEFYDDGSKIVTDLDVKEAVEALITTAQGASGGLNPVQTENFEALAGMLSTAVTLHRARTAPYGITITTGGIAA